MLTIIGCGNINRSDDGVGVYVAQNLQKHDAIRSRSDVRVCDAGSSGLDVIFQARGSKSLIIVDASNSGAEPGSIFALPGAEVENLAKKIDNLHEFRWDNALYAGKQLYADEFPKDITVYLIEAENLSLGCELSEIVLTAARKLVEIIAQQIPDPHD